MANTFDFEAEICTCDDQRKRHSAFSSRRSSYSMEESLSPASQGASDRQGVLFSHLREF